MTIAYSALLAVAAAGVAVAQDADWDSLMGRANHAERNRDYAQAAALFQQARELAGHFPSTDARRWATDTELGAACEQAGLIPESIRAFREAMELIKSAVGINNRTYAEADGSLATTFNSVGEFASAESRLREALAIELRLEPVDRVAVAMIQSRLGESLIGLHKHAEAERMVEAALPVLQNAGAGRTEVAIALNNLALVRQWQRRYDEAIRLLTSSIAMITAAYDAQHPLMLQSLNNLAVVYGQVGRDADADAAFRRAEAICDRYLPPTHPSHVALLANYAVFLRHTGEKSRAKAMEQEARSLSREGARNEGLGLTVDVSAFQRR
jgi:tetratricopeptide (TPR) repeat protein